MKVRMDCVGGRVARGGSAMDGRHAKSDAHGVIKMMLRSSAGSILVWLVGVA
jgi:hypothetical protein